MTTTEKSDFSRFGRAFQENLVQLILLDRPFSDQIREVFSTDFLELKYLQNNITQIACGTDYSLVLLENKTVISWGNNSVGQLPPNPNPDPDPHMEQFLGGSNYKQKYLKYKNKYIALKNQNI